MQTIKPAIVLVLLVWAHGTNAEEVIRLRSRITQVQPMTGIVLWSDNANLEEAADAITLEYCYVGYNEVLKPNGAYDYGHLDQLLDGIAGRNHQAILRFYFCYVGRATTVPEFIRSRPDYDETVGLSEGRQTHFCDWGNRALREFTIDFYAQIAKRYDNDPRVAFLQTGFGLWAEYHIYDGPRTIGKTFPSKSFQARFLRHLDEQFNSLPWSISVDSADADYSPLPNNRELLALSFGVFDDSFLCEPHPRENAINWRTLEPDRWQRQPGGGEFSYYNENDQRNALRADGPNGVSFEAAAKQYHISYMIGNDQPQYQPVARIKAAGMATGYRFRVTSATKNGDNLRLDVINEGVAPIYRDAYFAAGEKRSPTSLRGLLPGQTRKCMISNVGADDLAKVAIQSDAILPNQEIQFESSD